MTVKKVLIGWLILVEIIGMSWKAGQSHRAEAAGKERYLTIVSLVRDKSQWVSQEDWLEKQYELVSDYGWAATWLVDGDGLENAEIIATMNQFTTNQEVGLMLEVTPKIAQKLRLPYEKLRPIHEPENLFLSGYSIRQRQQIIDYLFETFRAKLGEYPKGVGAWFIDSWSLEYMRQKYGIETALLVAEQYGTDHHTVRGQPWQMPFYPAKNHILVPAGQVEDKIDVPIIQWAVREPRRGYGAYREHSNFSVQPNDYTQQGEGRDYLERLIQVYTDNPWQNLTQLTVGIEVGQEGANYWGEFKQMLAAVKRNSRGLQMVTMSEFGQAFRQRFPELPESQLISWYDAKEKVWVGWLTGRGQRVGMVAEATSVVIRDWRVYDSSQDDRAWGVDRQRELIKQTEGVIDEVTLKNSWLVIDDFGGVPQIRRDGEKITLAFKDKQITFEANKLITNFVPGNLSSKPEGVIIQGTNGGWEIVPQSIPISKEEGNLWWKIVLAMMAVGLAWRYRLLAAGLGATIGVMILSFELWSLTPLNELGVGYLVKIPGQLQLQAWMAYVVNPVIYGGLGVGIFWLIRRLTNSSWWAGLGELAFFAKSNWGWLLAFYRNLPVDPGLITGTKTNVYNFLGQVKFPTLAKLSYAFSEGQMNIKFLAAGIEESRWWLIVLASGFFVVMNLGLMNAGLVYWVAITLKKKRWLIFGGLMLLGLVTPLVVNKVDVRLPTILDVILEVGAIVGTVLLIRKVSHRTKLVGIVLAGLMVLAGWPTVSSVMKRNWELWPRVSSQWADRGKTRTILVNQKNLSDVFLAQVNHSSGQMIHVPMGIEQYFFMSAPQNMKVINQNSYATIRVIGD